MNENSATFAITEIHKNRSFDVNLILKSLTIASIVL